MNQDKNNFQGNIQAAIQTQRRLSFIHIELLRSLK